MEKKDLENLLSQANVNIENINIDNLYEDLKSANGNYEEVFKRYGILPKNSISDGTFLSQGKIGNIEYIIDGPSEETPKEDIEVKIQEETEPTKFEEVPDGDRDVAKIKSVYDNEVTPTYNADFEGHFTTGQINDVLSVIKSKAVSALENVNSAINTIPDIFNQLNEGTREKMNYWTGGANAVKETYVGISNEWASCIEDISTNLTKALDTARASDESEPSNGPSNFSEIDHGGGGKKKKTKKDPEEDTSKIINTVFGSLVFTSIVPLYTEIGKTSTIQSSLTNQYDVTGIFYQDGKFYYRLYDKSLKTVYFAEIDKNSTFTTNYKEVLKMKEENMMLNSPEIGDNTLSKLSKTDEVYFISGTTPGTGEAEGMTFVSVVDSSDGKTYYVALSDSVELTSIESLTTGTARTESVG